MAGTMKLFQQVQRIYRITGICPSSKHHQYSFNAKNTFGLVSTVLLLLSIFGYFAFKANSPDEYGEGFVGAVGTLEGLLYFLISLLKVERILKLIEKFEDFIETKVHNTALTIEYKKLIEKIENISKRMCALMCLIIVGIFIPAIVVGFINYYILDMGDESFNLTSPMIIPYNWKTPLKYLVTMIAIFLSIIPLISGIISTICILIGSSSLFIAFVNDLTNDLGFLNVGGVSTTESHMKMKERFCKIIQNHLDVKEFVDEFNSIYEYTFLAFFGAKLLMVCGSLMTFLLYLVECLKYKTKARK